MTMQAKWSLFCCESSGDTMDTLLASAFVSLSSMHSPIQLYHENHYPLYFWLFKHLQWELSCIFDLQTSPKTPLATIVDHIPPLQN